MIFTSNRLEKLDEALCLYTYTKEKATGYPTLNLNQAMQRMKI